MHFKIPFRPFQSSKRLCLVAFGSVIGLELNLTSVVCTNCTNRDVQMLKNAARRKIVAVRFPDFIDFELGHFMKLFYTLFIFHLSYFPHAFSSP